MTRMEIYDGCFLPNLTEFVKHTSTKPIPHPLYSKQRGGEGKRNVRGVILLKVWWIFLCVSCQGLHHTSKHF